MAKEKANDCFLLNFCSLSQSEMVRLAFGSDKDRQDSLVPLSKVVAKDNRKQQSMTWNEEFITTLFLTIGVPNGIFTVPAITLLIGGACGNIALSFKVLGVVLLPFVIAPQKFVASRLNCWMACQVARYFSFRFISTEQTKASSTRPQILVAPPHGVFPYGNLLAMLVWPTYTGNHFFGLAANAALRVPIFKQVLRGMGVIDASRTSARKALENSPYTIGISTGGVAEVFETNSGDECILLRERIGLIKLALRTGSDLIPCYIFGNTQLLSCWSGEGIPQGRNILEKISRKLGFALIVIYGRFGLPIPRRVPVLAVKGKSIVTVGDKCEEPTLELIKKYQDILIADMQTLFDEHKHLYQWEDKRLIIK